MADNERFPVKLYPSASISDVLFYVIRDAVLPAYKAPTYGTPYNDFKTRNDDWPNHKLVFISPSDADGKQKWYFAADRANQDDYNWSFTQGQELVRDYLLERALYYARNATEAAAASPLVTGELTVPIVAALDTRFVKYGFADDTVMEAPEELKSRYIVVRRRYLEPVTEEIDHDRELDIRFKITRTLVPTATGISGLPADSAGIAYELQPVNTFHSIQIKRECSPSTALADYAYKEPTRVQLQDLPRELISVAVVWNSSYSVGTQDFQFAKTATGDNYTLSGSGADQASSSASVNADIQVKWRDIETGNLFGMRHTFFLPVGSVTQENILTRLATAPHVGSTVLMWPVFRPESTTITASGQGVNVRVNASAGLEAQVSGGVTVKAGYDRGTSDDFAVSLGSNSVQLPPCIHGAIVFSGGTSQTQAVAATATIGIYNSLVGTITATKTKTGTAYGTVSPTSLAATAGTTTIPTSGQYLIDYDPRLYDLGYVKVTAITFNAASLA